MSREQPRPRVQRALQVAGLALVLYFGVRLIGVLLLPLTGVLTRGHCEALPGAETVADAGPVIYFYMAGERTLRGWRRGIHYGEPGLKVVYCRWSPGFHVTSLRDSLGHPGDLWRDPDYLLRLFLSLFGVCAGVGVGFAGRHAGRLTPERLRFLLGAERPPRFGG